MTNSVPDYPDWTQPVALQEQVTPNLLPVGGLAPGFSAGPYDSAGMESLTLTAHMTGGAAGLRSSLQVQWTEASATASWDDVSFHTAPSYSGIFQDLFWRLPVRGSAFTVWYYSEDAANIAVECYGSTRQLSGPIVQPVNNYGGVLLDTGTLNITNGGTSANYYLPPTTNGWIINTPNALIAKLFATISGISLAGLLWNYSSIALLGNDGNALMPFNVRAAGIGGKLTVHNSTGAAASASAQAWPLGS